MNQIRHRSRAHSMRGQNVFPTFDVTYIDDLQPLLLRLGLNTGESRPVGFDRVAHTKLIASALVSRGAVRP